MKKIIRTFINNQTFPNCLIVLIKDEETTSIDKRNNVTVLFNQDEVIGYNIVSEEFKTLKDGYHPISENIDLINNILEKEGLEQLEADLNNYFKVGKVIECVEHPESDHLHICKVDIGNDVLQIVCGAHNVEEGIKVVVACVNAIMPNGSLITAGKLRGVDSYGMLCSAYELGLIEEHIKGLLILDETYNVGDNFKGGK